MPNQVPEQNDDKLYTLSAGLLRAGNMVSILLLSSGILLSLWYGNYIPHHTHSLLAAWHNLRQGEPQGFLEVGLQIVILTPMLLSLAICLYAIAHKQRSLLIPSLLVLGGLVLSLWIGIAW
ncbi:MAG: hypothetical protein KatS3mg022_2580 [Armatimonadota bacterium]|nr:MAG: hypothetical protein KatS3mg022_2580 [Armatimonadota bacterium]